MVICTAETIAQVHGFPPSLIQIAFQRNHQRFIEGTHYFRLTLEEMALLGIPPGVRTTLKVFTRSGYLLLLKPFTDRRSLTIQEDMVETYFGPWIPTDSFGRAALLMDPTLLEQLTHDVQSQQALLDKLNQQMTCVEAAIEAVKTLGSKALVTAKQAERIADLALDDSHWLTIEEFLSRHGLLQRFPREQHRLIARWLMTFCKRHKFSTWAMPGLGKTGSEARAYPLIALASWLRHAWDGKNAMALPKSPQHFGQVDVVRLSTASPVSLADHLHK